MPIALIEERLRDDLSSNLYAVEREAHRRWQDIKTYPQGFEPLSPP